MKNELSIATIVLCGGQIDLRDLPVSLTRSNAMIPVNGRPVIGWILNDLLEKSIDNVIVVTRAEDILLHQFLENSYFGRMELNLARLYRAGSILESLKAGLALNGGTRRIRIVLGDTLITDSYDRDLDFVYTGAVDYSGRWCVVECDEAKVITRYIEKQSDADSSAVALAGYYHFTNAELLRDCVTQSIEAGETELSDALGRYGRNQPLTAIPVRDWIDFGHLDKLAEARRRLISSRSFNSLRIDPVLQTVTKTSSFNEKLKNELNWYLQLPSELQVLSPRILKHTVTAEKVQFTQEFYGYPSLAELFVFGQFSILAWESILHRVLEVHHLLAGHSATVSPADTFSMYFHKTQQRLQMLQQDSEWQELLGVPYVNINGRDYSSIDSLMPQIESFCHELAATACGGIIHGDLCFSNILFDLPNQIVRLIDPRGSFGQPGIYGDPRYDAAKLRHSVSGHYDFIVADMFQIRQSGDRFDVLTYSSNQPNLEAQFDRLLLEAGYDLRQLRFIEGLLFASMIPLHGDRPQRQKMMFCQAVRLLNEALRPDKPSVVRTPPKSYTAV